LYDLDDRLRPVRDGLWPRRGDAVLVAHFFGFAQPFDDLCEELRAAGVTVIEDCAHLLRPGREGSSTGYLGDWTIFSFRKPLPVACGGMLLGRGLDGKGVGARVCGKLTLRHWLLLAERVGPSIFGRYYCALVEWMRERLDPVRGPQGWQAADEERISAMTLRALQSIDVDAIADRRCSNYRMLASHLAAGIPGFTVPFPELPRGSVPLVMPVRVDRPAASAARLRAEGIGAFLWPGFEVLADIDWSRYPGTRAWLDSLVCLPVHQDLSAPELERIADACRRVAQERGED
jgi:dTDP-4-amino-4,6-dideoxygalactose transaminase